MRLNTKRAGQLTPFEAWAVYYAGYPLKFALEVLAKLAPAGAEVLDPWNGSGTTLVAAKQLGLRSHGVDLNPYAQLLAQARLHRGCPNQFRHAASDALAPTGSRHSSPDDSLSAWLSNVQLVRSFHANLIDILPNEDPYRPSFCALFTIQCIRRTLSVSTGSNPTWVKPPKHPSTVTQDDWARAVNAEAAVAASVLETMPPLTDAEARVGLGDSRALALPNDSIDFVLTSPPYCTRIDYAVATSLELSFMGMERASTSFSALRRALMGTTCIRKTVPNTSLPGEVACLLDRIENHGSYESSGYYFKNHRQYFHDCYASIQEIARVLRSGASAVLVVQDSYFKDLHIDLPRLIQATGSQCDLLPSVVSNVPVPRNLVDINPRARRNRGRRPYHEQVIRLRKQ